eukprot:3402713-Pyramimonas_sp.AAC.1
MPMSGFPPSARVEVLAARLRRPPAALSRLLSLRSSWAVPPQPSPPRPRRSPPRPRLAGPVVSALRILSGPYLGQLGRAPPSP